MTEENEYLVNCENGHELSLSLSDIEEILENELCPECEGKIESIEPDDFSVECLSCMWENFVDWEAAGSHLVLGCPRCSGTVYLVGSFAYEIALNEPELKEYTYSLTTRKGRPDYWYFLTHFCKRDEFVKILDGNIIQAKQTGYFNVPAVCFTHVPLSFTKEIRKRQGEYGIVFREKDIYGYGGQPAIYIRENLLIIQNSLQGFSDYLKPFINLIRTPEINSDGEKKIYNFYHEREWRVPKDVDLNILQPLGLIYPEGDNYLKYSGPSWDKLIKYASKFGQIRQE